VRLKLKGVLCGFLFPDFSGRGFLRTDARGLSSCLVHRHVVDGDLIDGEISSILASPRGYLITRSAAPPLSYAIIRRPSRPKQHRDFHQTERRLTSHRSGDIAQARKKGGLKFLYSKS
jgi:hypothetical protein